MQDGERGILRLTISGTTPPSFDNPDGGSVTWVSGQTAPVVTVPEANGVPAPSYAVVGALPAGVTFDPATREITPVPTSSAVGSGTITIRATNSTGMADWTLSYTVNSVPPMVQIDTEAQTVQGGSAVGIQATATDPDGQIVAYRWTTTGGRFNNAAIEDPIWTAPAATRALQTFTLTLEVEDDNGRTAQASVMMTVAAAQAVTVTVAAAQAVTVTEQAWKISADQPAPPAAGAFVEGADGWTGAGQPRQTLAGGVWTTTRQVTTLLGVVQSRTAWATVTQVVPAVDAVRGPFFADLGQGDGNNNRLRWQLGTGQTTPALALPAAWFDDGADGYARRFTIRNDGRLDLQFASDTTTASQTADKDLKESILPLLRIEFTGGPNWPDVLGDITPASATGEGIEGDTTEPYRVSVVDDIGGNFAAIGGRVTRVNWAISGTEEPLNGGTLAFSLTEDPTPRTELRADLRSTGAGSASLTVATPTAVSLQADLRSTGAGSAELTAGPAPIELQADLRSTGAGSAQLTVGVEPIELAADLRSTGAGSASLSVIEPDAVELEADLRATGAGSADLTVTDVPPTSMAADLRSTGAGSASLSVTEPDAVELEADLRSTGAGTASLTLTEPTDTSLMADLRSTGAGSAQLRVQKLALSDFDRTGLRVDFAALLIRTSSSAGVLYADSNRAGTDTPAEGELGYGSNNTPITRIWWRGDRLTLNDNTAGTSLAAYFGVNGAGRDMRLYLITEDGEADVAVSDVFASNGIGSDNFIQFGLSPSGAIPDDMDALLDGIAVNDRFIFAGAFVVPPVSMAADLRSTGAGTASLTVTEPPAVTLEADLRATGAGSANLSVVEGVELQADLRSTGAGSASLTVTESTAPDVDLAADLRSTGAGEARLLVTAADAVELRADLRSTGAGSASLTRTPASMVPVQEIDHYALSQARSLSGKAPRFALEITHPDITEPIRVVGDNVNHTIDGETYTALAFRAEPPQFQEGQVPRTTLEIDNVGRELTRWVEETNGGRGAKMKTMMVHKDPRADHSHIVWQLPPLAVGVADLTNELVRAQLVFRSGRSRPGVKLRHDPVTSPGLF